MIDQAQADAYSTFHPSSLLFIPLKQPLPVSIPLLRWPVGSSLFYDLFAYLSSFISRGFQGLIISRRRALGNRSFLTYFFYFYSKFRKATRAGQICTQ
jgi:hypothetical protein